MTEAQLDVEALYGALDARRKRKALSWRDVAREAGVSASTLTRMAQGKRPDVDGFAALVDWLGMPADSFLKAADAKKAKKADPVAMFSTFLRASKELDEQSVEFLEDILQAAWKRVKKT